MNRLQLYYFKYIGSNKTSKNLYEIYIIYKSIKINKGEKNVYRKRGDDPNADNSLNMEKPKRLRLVVVNYYFHKK